MVYVERGHRRYELSNHLGNVLATITDRRDCFTEGETVYYEADIITVTDYYAKCIVIFLALILRLVGISKNWFMGLI